MPLVETDNQQQIPTVHTIDETFENPLKEDKREENMTKAFNISKHLLSRTNTK